MNDLRDDEQRAIEAMQSAAVAEAVSPFATARAVRALDAAIDADARARARWTTTRVAAVALVAAASAGALAFHLARTPADIARAPAGLAGLADLAGPADLADLADLAGPAGPTGSAGLAAPAAPAASSTPAAFAAHEPSAGAASALDVASAAASVGVPAPVFEGNAPESAPLLVASPWVPGRLDAAVEPVKRARRNVVRESELLVAAGDAVGAARLLVLAQAGADGAGGPGGAGAAAALALLARRFPDAVSAVDEELAAVRTADAMRLRCQHRLLHQRDRRAMEACRAFGREHPQDAAARLLSFAAGRLAEDLGDLAWAEEEYSRALLLSPFAGLSGTDALLARARVRHAAGDDDEARADLRLYLHSESAARGEPDVANLATALGL